MMEGIECRAARREIDQAEVNQQLSPQAAAHVTSCASCGEFKSERASLRELLGSLEPVTAPADFDFKLRARIAQQSGSPRSFFRSFMLSTPALASLVLFAVIALAIVLFMPRRGNRAPISATNQPGQATSADATASKQSTKPDREASPVKNRGGQEGEVVYHAPIGRGSQNKGRRLSQLGANSMDFSDSAAGVIRQGDPNVDEVTISAPLRPMVLSLQDNNGATRTIALPPVSFGSQRLLESRRLPVSQGGQKTRSW